jgi:hypothetical protein
MSATSRLCQPARRVKLFAGAFEGCGSSPRPLVNRRRAPVSTLLPTLPQALERLCRPQPRCRTPSSKETRRSRTPSRRGVLRSEVADLADLPVDRVVDAATGWGCPPGGAWHDTRHLLRRGVRCSRSPARSHRTDRSRLPPEFAMPDPSWEENRQLAVFEADLLGRIVRALRSGGYAAAVEALDGTTAEARVPRQQRHDRGSHGSSSHR